MLATCGDNHLGGDDFDERIARWLTDNFEAEQGIDLTRDPVAMQRIREEAEKAKKELSSARQAEINLPFISAGPSGPLHMQATLTRAAFDEMTADLIERTALPVKNALRDAGLAANDLDQVLLVGGSTRIPAVQAKVLRMVDLEPSKTLNPDECVALGAAVQGGRLGGEMLAAGGEGLLLMDVTPLTLSIETVGGVATHLIERNSTIPTRFSKIFTTAAPFQSTVEIKVLQGEREFAKDNKLLGTFTLRGIKRAWAGVPQIEVTFDIDANGIVTVSARDLETGKQQSITITGTSNLSEEEIQRAMRDAAAYASQDAEKKAAVEALNAGESTMYRVNTALGSKAGKALDKESKNRIKEAERALVKQMRHKKAEKMTPRGHPQPGRGAGGAGVGLGPAGRRLGGRAEQPKGLKRFWQPTRKPTEHRAAPAAAARRTAGAAGFRTRKTGKAALQISAVRYSRRARAKLARQSRAGAASSTA